MKKEYLLVVLVVIVVFTGIFFFSKKKISIQSLSYYRGGGDSVSSYRIELSSNYLSICKTDDNNDTDEKRFVVDDNLYNQINEIVNKYQLQKMKNLKESDVMVLDGEVEILKIKLDDDNTILLSSNYDLPDKAIKTTREILQLIHTYYDNNIE